jgi:hypothetical protein
MMYLALAGACLMGSGVLAAPILNDPYAIFAVARTHWEIANYPSQLSYTVGVTVTRHGVTSEAHYHSYYDSLVNRVNVTAVSDEEFAHPYTPHGISVFFSPFGAHIPLSSPEHTFDYLGVPLLAPNYSFGISTYVPHNPDANSAKLVAEIRREFCDPPPVKSPAPDSGLKTIANIDVVRRSYIIMLNGITALNGHKDYDLTLRPIRDPGRYRLRQLWIDTGSFATDKLISQGNFTDGGMTGVQWTVLFHQVNGVSYLTSERTEQPFVISRRSYDSATIAFTNITPKRIPSITQISDFAINEQSGAPPLTEPH